MGDLERLVPANIVVRMPNWIGDMVMATPILADLRHAYPNAAITAVCRSNVAPILARDPAIDRVLAFQRPKGKLRRLDDREVIETLRRGKYDLGILLTHSFSSAWQFRRGRVGHIIGLQTDGRGFLLDHRLPRKGQRQHLVLTYKELLTPLGIPLSKTAPRLFLSDREVERAWDLIGRFGICPRHTIIGIHPVSARGTKKCWSPARFREVAVRLMTDPSNRILFLADATHRERVKKICEGLSRCVNLAGKTTLRELMAILKISSLFLTNDSGPMHLADSLATPLVALFGPTDPMVTGPYHRPDRVIDRGERPRSFWKRRFPFAPSHMERIGVDEVCLSIAQIMREQVCDEI